MVVWKVVFENVVSGAGRNSAEAKGGFDRGRVGEPLVVQTGEVGELFPGDHEGRQVGRVDGQKDEGKGGPNVGHEPRRVAARTIDVDCRLKEDRPNQPQGPQK